MKQHRGHMVVLLPEHTASYLLPEDGPFPNNRQLPVIYYPHALQLHDEAEDGSVDQLLADNQWPVAWRNGIYDYHHFHSTAHECLVVCSGRAKVLLGGARGIEMELHMGDVLILPAGVAHKCLHADADFSCIGAYPEGQSYNILKGSEDELEAAREAIERVPLPEADPVYAKDGPLVELWNLPSKP